MSYRCQVINKAEANQAAVLAEINAELQAMGWSVHDAANGVYSSNGETGTELTQYVKIYGSGTTILCESYYYWNASTHAGIGRASNSSQATSTETGNYLWIAGNKNMVWFMVKVGSSYTSAGFGFPNRRQLTVNTTLSSSATSGSNKQLTVASTAGFVAGRLYQIVGVSQEGRDTLTVNTVDDATHLTVASLPRNYGSGALLGQTPCIFGSFSVTLFALTCHGAASGTTNCSYYGLSSLSYYTYYEESGAQDWRAQADLLVPILIGDTNTNVSKRYSFAAYVDEYFLQGSRCATVEDVMAVGKQTSGTATSATGTTIVNSGAAWTVDAYIGKCVIITSGTGLGQVRKITDNDGTTLTVDRAWDTNPVSGSAYMIADEAYMGFATGTSLYVRVGC